MNIEEIRKFCLSLPHVTEDVKWGNDLCFSIGGKMFCVGYLEPPPFSVSFKVDDADFDALSQSPEIIPAPYVARYKWVQVQNQDRLSQTEWISRIRRSYDLVFEKLPPKIRKGLA